MLFVRYGARASAERKTSATSLLRRVAPRARLANKRRITGESSDVPIPRRARRGFEFAGVDDRLIAGARARSAGYVRGARRHWRSAYGGALLPCPRGAVGGVSGVGARRSGGGVWCKGDSSAVHAPGDCRGRRACGQECGGGHADGFGKDALL